MRCDSRSGLIRSKRRIFIRSESLSYQIRTNIRLDQIRDKIKSHQNQDWISSHWIKSKIRSYRRFGKTQYQIKIRSHQNLSQDQNPIKSIYESTFGGEFNVPSACWRLWDTHVKDMGKAVCGSSQTQQRRWLVIWNPHTLSSISRLDKIQYQIYDQIISSHQHGIDFRRCPCQVHGIGCWWLILKPKTACDKWYEIHTLDAISKLNHIIIDIREIIINIRQVH